MTCLFICPRLFPLNIKLILSIYNPLTTRFITHKPHLEKSLQVFVSDIRGHNKIQYELATCCSSSLNPGKLHFDPRFYIAVNPYARRIVFCKRENIIMHIINRGHVMQKQVCRHQPSQAFFWYNADYNNVACRASGWSQAVFAEDPASLARGNI